MGDGAAVLGSLNILFLGLQPLYRNVAPGQCKCSSVTCDLSMRVGRAHLMICIDRVDLSYSTGDCGFRPPALRLGLGVISTECCKPELREPSFHPPRTFGCELEPLTGAVYGDAPLR